MKSCPVLFAALPIIVLLSISLFFLIKSTGFLYPCKSALRHEATFTELVSHSFQKRLTLGFWKNPLTIYHLIDTTELLHIALGDTVRNTQLTRLLTYSCLHNRDPRIV